MSTQDTIKHLAARQQGVSNNELQQALDRTQKQVGRHLQAMTGSGAICKGGASQPHRWFTTQSAADAYVSPGLFQVDGLSRGLIEVCSRPGGASAEEARKELPAYDELVSQRMSYLTHRGLLFRGGNRIPYRWFSDQAEALDYVSPAKPASSVKRKHRAVNPLRNGAQISPHWRSLPSKSSPQAINPNGVKAQVIPTGTDHRFTVKTLPQGYRSHLDPSDCRAWAQQVFA